MSNDLQSLVTKIMSDEAFVDALASNPAAALEGAGITPTAEILEALQGVDAAAIKTLASSFKEDQAAAV